MAINYPGSLDEFVAKIDGEGEWVYSAHMNKVQQILLAIETELGTNPAGSLTDVKTRLAVMLNDNGTLKQPAQVVTVGSLRCHFTTIQAAINSISDAASNKIYTVLVYPGFYNEVITLKNWVNVVAVDPYSTFILGMVTDNNVACHCYLKISIASASGDGLYTENIGSVITVDGNVSSSDGYGLNCYRGTQNVNGHVSSSANKGLYCRSNGIIVVRGSVSSTYAASGAHGVYNLGGNVSIYGNISATHGVGCYISTGTLHVSNSVIHTTWDTIWGHGIQIAGGLVICQNVKILCTHADVNSFYTATSADVYSMPVFTNRDDVKTDITQIIPEGFFFNANIQ